MANTTNCYTEENGKLEHMFAIAANNRLNTMPVGWCDNELLDISGSGDNLNYFDFAAGEVYYEQIHIPHGVDFSRGSLDFDLHFFSPDANTGDVVVKVSLWHLYAGRTMSGIVAPDATYTKTIPFATPVQNMLGVAYTEDAIDCSSWEANRTVHDGMLYKLEVLSAGTTKAGTLGVLHQELWFPTTGLLGPV